MTRRSQTPQEAARLVAALNRKINGWANYFCLGPVSKAYRAVEEHTRRRLRQWLCVKHKERAGGNTRFPQKALHQKLAWFALQRGPPAFRGRQREPFLRELDALTAPVQFDKRGVWKRGRVRLLRHRQTKGPDSVRPPLTRRATPRLHLKTPVLGMLSAVGI